MGAILVFEATSIAMTRIRIFKWITIVKTYVEVSQNSLSSKADDLLIFTNQGMCIHFKLLISKWNLFQVSWMFEGRISSQFKFAFHTSYKILKITMKAKGDPKGQMSNNYRYSLTFCVFSQIEFTGSLFHSFTLILEFTGMNWDRMNAPDYFHLRNLENFQL